ncbi:TetR/AcrR family transcriptional regulator [Jannaschia sp. CCS1]|uniref:TetR/AcrR family transcriptional regulator n=1 Tax=Jannaschia sp. (strain CCS1) TaxID=290400 RepID=UPI000053A403|nr:TetR/AcrR family transcriptional regulator [Jannaschia sp. CCS1]ABD57083.1 transcriptional regulator, TetR family [Jannaschia sp. CCS1]
MAVAPPQSEKEQQIAAAALRVFSRYGLKRATMNDIAEEAGVVRQTLYNVFANKDEVIHGTLLFYKAGLRQTVADAWRTADSLGEKLDLFFEHYILCSWDAARQTPDAAELETSSLTSIKTAMREADAATEEMLTELFMPHTDALTQNGQDPQSFAIFVNATLIGLKHNTDDRDALTAHLAALKAVILHLIR